MTNLVIKNNNNNNTTTTTTTTKTSIGLKPVRLRRRKNCHVIKQNNIGILSLIQYKLFLKNLGG